MTADTIARAICQERCAFKGEPACWQVVPDEWPNPNCDDPGCQALATVAMAATAAADGDTCDTCGRVFRTAYRVPNDLWRQIAPKPETLGDHPEHLLGGTLCPDCATVAADRIGQKLHFDADDHGWGGAPVSPGVAAIAAERRRQVEVEGWTPAHDDAHQAGELAGAAACYAMHGLSIGNMVLARNVRGMVTSLWPWAADWWKPKDPLTDLARAGALIAAEYDRQQRAALTQEGA
ncbi:hypothetical protein [Chachezhania sediminis]|uniref:hypothetical protein n=1 Tax=Chachezhania sediminis TaxID=2599291 RepID=UPI0018EF0B63|nr:hypothetical protein [Chachezhania sediminis]